MTRGKNRDFGVFMLQYHLVVNVCIIMHYQCMTVDLVDNNRKHFRGSPQATVHPLAIMIVDNSECDHSGLV